MNDERMMILSMLSSGKITDEEAAKLLDALDQKESENDFKVNLDKNKSEKSKQKSKTWDIKFKKEHLDNLEKLGEELGSKVEKISEDLAEGATALADKLLGKLDNFIKSNDGININSFFGSYDTKSQAISRIITNAEGKTLDFSAVNGHIVIKSWPEDNMRIDAECKYKKSVYEVMGDFYEIKETDDKISIYPKYTKNISTSLDIMIPNKTFERIYANTKNSRIKLNTISAKNLFCETKNSSIRLVNCTSEKASLHDSNSSITIENSTIDEVEAITSNAKIQLINSSLKTVDGLTKNGGIICEYINSDNLSLVSSNATVKLNDLRCKAIKAKTSNATIKAHNINTNDLKLVNLYTTNSSINLSLDSNPKSYDVEAHTSNGNIALNIPNMVYKNNDISNRNKKILAISEGAVEPDITIKTVTTNGSININKADKTVNIDVTKS
ncbi:DUF4097 family beta strand repeat-containing protein [Clostridiaceae bacterium M8S5]|nr:DUF4097 family beta strand repeat-containing protein [Clostridiaceae bacterium M8S5]